MADGVPTIRTFQVFPDLPAELEPLLELARNLWWVWNPDAVELFRRLDRKLWEDVYHNPVKMLGSIAQSKLAAWNVRASAAGRDCSVLLIDTSVVMEESMVEALHYGGGDYSIVDDAGAERFCRQRAFRGVAYRDATGRIWAYDLSADEARTLKRCD